MNLHSLFNVILLFGLVFFQIIWFWTLKISKGRNKKLTRVLKTMRPFHPYIGLTLIISGAIHGYLKLGGQLSFHTGSLLLIFLMANGLIGFMYKRTKKRPLASLHRLVGVGVLVSFFIHYFKPWLFL